VQSAGSLVRMIRNRIALIVTTLGLSGLLGLTACAAAPGASRAPAAAVADAAADQYASDVGDEVLALTAVGLETGLEEAPAPTPSSAADKADKARKKGPARKLLRKNTLHGELTVQTKKGVKTVAVQRGTVTASTATTLTVKSTDGFTQTWTLADTPRIRKDRKKADGTAVTKGAEVAVAGPKTADTPTARLIIVG
jgi:hypothetical protein